MELLGFFIFLICGVIGVVLLCINDVDFIELASILIITGVNGIIIILAYCTRKAWLYPMFQLFVEPNDGLILLSLLLVLLCIDYIIAFSYDIPKIAFLTIAFVINILLAKMAPIISIAIIWSFLVIVYSILIQNNRKVIIIELVLQRAMIIINTVLFLLQMINVSLSIFLLSVVVIFSIVLSFVLEKFIVR